MSAAAPALYPHTRAPRNRRPAPAIVSRLRSAPAVEPVICVNPDCGEYFTPTRTRTRTCSPACAQRVAVLASVATRAYLKAGRAYAERHRGSNPDRHIRIRINGEQKLLHRVIVERAEGRELMPDQIVHHRDGNKHHNCYADSLCARRILQGRGNLEILTGPAAHAKIHEEDLKRARRRAMGKR